MSNVLTTRIRRTRATLALLLAALGVLTGATPALAAGDTPTASADCAAASYLIQDGHPVEALALIRSLRDAGVAAADEDDAVARRIAAAACSDAFDRAVDEICVEAGELNSDGKFADAVTLIGGVRDPAIDAVGGGTAPASERSATRACEAEFDVATEGAGATTWSDDLGSTWQTFVDDWIAPLQPLGLWIGGIVIGAIIVARLLAAIIGYPRWTPAVMRWMALGMAVIVIGAVFLVLGLSPTDAPPLPVTWLVVLGAALLVLGILGTTMFLGGRLRLSVIYSGTAEDPAAAAEIIGKLVILGGGRMRGVEFASAPDIKALEGASLSSAITDTTVKAVLAAVNEVFASIPWVVKITEIAGVGVDAAPVGHVVTVSRNGRTKVSQVIETGRLRYQALGSDEPLEPQWFIASVILVTFAGSYWGFGGLDKHSDWRSLGLGVVARERFAAKEDEASSLTALALRIDGNNFIAEYNYKYFRYRHQSDLAGTIRYADWLRSVLTSRRWRRGRPRWSADLMEIRMLTNSVSVERNLNALAKNRTPPEPPTTAWIVDRSGRVLEAPVLLMAIPGARTRARRPVPEPDRELEEALACRARLALEANNRILRRLRKPQKDPVLAEMRYRAVVAAWLLHAWSPSTPIAATRAGVLAVIADAERSTSPGVAYSTLCRWAVTGKISATFPPQPDVTAKVVVPSPCTLSAGDVTSSIELPEVSASDLADKLRVILDSRYVVIELGEKGTKKAPTEPPSTEKEIAALERIDWLAQDPELAGIQKNPVYTETVKSYLEAEKKRLLAEAARAEEEEAAKKKAAKDAKKDEKTPTPPIPPKAGAVAATIVAAVRRSRGAADSGREMKSELPD
jgi:hypothetical protein